MIEPNKKDIGRKVIYTGNRYPGDKPVEGIITSFNTKYVFVRYGNNVTSAGTNRQDLEWITGQNK